MRGRRSCEAIVIRKEKTKICHAKKTKWCLIASAWLCDICHKMRKDCSFRKYRVMRG